jgi:hypothetical protein
MGAESEFFQWALSPGDYLLALRLRDGPPPIGEDTLDKIANAFEKPERDGYFAYFYVAPDDEAFRLLRLARKALWEKDIEVGWIPADARKGLVFGAGGRLVQPQK